MPSFSAGKIFTNNLEDEVSFLQYGQQEESSFYNYNLKSFEPSSWIIFPTAEKPNTLYKYVSVEINLSQDVVNWNRQTYSLLDWLGDLGGLFDALYHGFRIMLSPFSTFALNSTLLTHLFRFK